jgi:hypothetical protein
MQLMFRLIAFAAAVSPFLPNAAPVLMRSADVIPGFMPSTDATSIAAHHHTVRSLVRRDEPDVEREFDLGNFKGYLGSFDAATADALKALPEVSRCIMLMKSEINMNQVLLVEPDYLLHSTALVTRKFPTLVYA